MKSRGSWHVSTWRGALARILMIVLALLPLLVPVHVPKAKGTGFVLSHTVAVTAASPGHGSHCPPADGGGSGACTVMPCCGVIHAGCCPLPVVGAELPHLSFAKPDANVDPVFASLRTPPPLPPPIALSAQ